MSGLEFVEVVERILTFKGFFVCYYLEVFWVRCLRSGGAGGVRGGGLFPLGRRFEGCWGGRVGSGARFCK